jgi:hypothetical protein
VSDFSAFFFISALSLTGLTLNFTFKGRSHTSSVSQNDLLNAGDQGQLGLTLTVKAIRDDFSRPDST